MDTQERIKKLVQENPLLLFMKGTPQAPQCGFSARVVQLLDFMKIRYESFDVLSDEQIRQGIKVYGNWPTIPQLYAHGELIGGCDIIEEEFQAGTLEKKLKKFHTANE